MIFDLLPKWAAFILCCRRELSRHVSSFSIFSSFFATYAPSGKRLQDNFNLHPSWKCINNDIKNSSRAVNFSIKLNNAQFAMLYVANVIEPIITKSKLCLRPPSRVFHRFTIANVSQLIRNKSLLKRLNVSSWQLDAYSKQKTAQLLAMWILITRFRKSKLAIFKSWMYLVDSNVQFRSVFEMI